MTDVIASPTKAFESIASRPTWLAPALVYLVILVAALALFCTKADWVAIDSAMIEGMIGKMVPEKALDEAVNQATTVLKRFSPAQLVVYKTLERTTGLPFFLFGMVVIYATLFVFMGAFPSLKLGSAWLGFLMACLVFLAYIGVSAVSTRVYATAPASMLLINGGAGIVMVAAWFWLLHRQATKDPEFHKALGVCAHAMIIPAVGGLALIGSVMVAAPGIAVPPENFVKSNLGAWVDVSSPVLRSLLSSLDLFTLWFMVVLTIGFRAVTRLSFGLAASITWLPWAVIVLVKLAFRAIFG